MCSIIIGIILEVLLSMLGKSERHLKLNFILHQDNRLVTGKRAGVVYSKTASPWLSWTLNSLAEPNCDYPLQEKCDLDRS